VLGQPFRRCDDHAIPPPGPNEPPSRFCNVIDGCQTLLDTRDEKMGIRNIQQNLLFSRLVYITILWLLLSCVVHASSFYVGRANTRPAPGSQIQPILPPVRPAIPPSLQDVRFAQPDVAPQARAATRATTGLVCGENVQCASFAGEGEMPDVSAWMGFPYQESGMDFFIATHSQEAVYLGDGQYATPLWDKQHVWIRFDDSNVPFPLQPRYVGTDLDSGHDFYAVDYLGYRFPTEDYSGYPFGISISSMVVEVDPASESVVDYYIEYYDENDSYIGKLTPAPGDEIQSYFLGFEKSEPDVVYLFYLEDAALVTKAPEFFFAELYPGKDFPCTYCGDLDLANIDFYYIFESYSEARSDFTDPLPILRVPDPCPIDPDAMDQCSPADTELMNHEVVSGNSDRCVTDDSLLFSGQVDQGGKLLLESGRVRLLEGTRFAPGSCVRIQTKTPDM
jgi:hypothetical protein